MIEENKEELMKFNKYQTPLTQELIDSYPKEVIDELYEYINSVPYIQRLVSPDRKYAKDLERDSQGRIIVDLANPHIIEDMDYFMETRNHFLEHGTYTKLRVNTSPYSEWMKWFRQELDRCWNGMTRPSDGEWITGDFYFFLNYNIMTQTVIKETSTGGTYGSRIESLPEPWEGIYFRFHYLHQARYGGKYNDFKGGDHGAEIASRGKGKSYSLGSMLSRLFTIGIGEKELSTKRKALIVADLKTYLIDDGTLNKFEDSLDHLAKNTEFPQHKERDSLTNMYWLCGWEDENGNAKGAQNLVLGQAIGDDADKSRGKRSDLMLGEEFGKFGKFSEWWSTSMPNVQEGEIVFGLGYVLGTGGTEGSDFTGALDMIYSPESNHIYGIPNVFDKGSTGNKKTIFFYPAFLNYKPYQNKDGVSDVIGAMLSELSERYELKYNSDDPLKLTRRKAEFAFTLQDAIMRRDSTLYPVADINDRINQLDSDPTYMDDMYIGKIELSGSEVKWKPDSNVNVITKFPHKDNKLEGGLLIKTMPIKGSDGRVPWGRYVAGGDFYDDDTSNTLSLGSVWILDLWTDDIVAEYTGRPMFADDLYEIVRRLLLLYNAELNYESNKKGIFAYFSKYNSLYLLADTLEFLRDKDMAKISYGNKSKGTANYSSTKKGGVAGYARRCLRDYLLKPFESTKIEEIDGEQVEVVTTIPNLFRIKFRAALQELALWNMDGNFDRHDALMMLMLIREDKLRLIGDGDFESRYKDNHSDYLGNDDFFERSFKKHDNKRTLYEIPNNSK